MITITSLWESRMKFNVREVEFDFDDDYANGFKLTFEEMRAWSEDVFDDVAKDYDLTLEDDEEL